MAAFAEGRLTADEHGERLSAAYAARTWQQLRQLTADLAGTAGTTDPTAAPGMAAGPDLCLLCLLLIVCPPAGIAWWLLSRRRRGADPDGQLTAAAAQAGGGRVPKIAEQARAARREQIIAAGLACFARSGYHAATMADVAAQAGVSKGTPYLYFGTQGSAVPGAARGMGLRRRTAGGRGDRRAARC